MNISQIIATKCPQTTIDALVRMKREKSLIEAQVVATGIMRDHPELSNGIIEVLSKQPQEWVI